MKAFPVRLLTWSFLLVVGLVGLSSLSQANQQGTAADTYMPLIAIQPTLTPTPTPSIPPIPNGTLTPNDPYFGEQWNMHRIRMEESWAVTTGGPVVVAVIDTGVDYTHPDLVNRMVSPSHWYDFANNDTDPQDDVFHGTHVAGIVGSSPFNGAGIVGVSWGAQIMPLKVLGSDGSGTDADVARAIIFAADHGARIINMSLGGSTFSGPLESAVAYARERNVLVIAAAGNSFQEGNPTSWPAALPGVVGVGATGFNDEHADYSNSGYYLDVAAPGGAGDDYHLWILSGIPVGFGYWPPYAYASGTSMAAPHVAGLASLIWTVRPSLSADEVAYILQASAVDLGTSGRDDFFGHGRIDARHALEMAWYWGAFQANAAQGMAAADAAAPLPTLPSAPDCSVPHQGDSLLLREGAASQPSVSQALAAAPDVVASWPGWQLVRVAEGQACALATALNERAGEPVAALNLLYSLPEGAVHFGAPQE